MGGPKGTGPQGGPMGARARPGVQGPLGPHPVPNHGHVPLSPIGPGPLGPLSISPQPFGPHHLSRNPLGRANAKKDASSSNVWGGRGRGY